VKFSSEIIYLFSLDVNQIELNKCNSEGQTPLLLYMKLARTNPNYAEIIKLLLMSGANPKIKDKNSWGPLDEAITQVIFFVEFFK